MAAGVETKEEIEIEITRIIEVETEETTVTGSVRSVITRTSHSELNAIAVASLKEEAAGTTGEVETEMTAETVAETNADAVAETNVETETKETPIEALTRITTGLVANVKTQISHSELNAIAVEPLKEEAEARASDGQVMNAEQAIEEIRRNLEREIGNALSVENPISLNGMIALAVGAPRESVALSREVIIVS